MKTVDVSSSLDLLVTHEQIILYSYITGDYSVSMFCHGTVTVHTLFFLNLQVYCVCHMNDSWIKLNAETHNMFEGCFSVYTTEYFTLCIHLVNLR